MVKLLFTTNPDNGNQVPVILDTSSIDVTGVTLSRGSVEGNSRALNADVSFDTSVNVPKPGVERQFDVRLHVLTEGHVVPMTEGMTIKSVGELQKPWDLASTSGGHGDIHAVLVKTILHEPETY
jgi:hypothetical protein